MTATGTPGKRLLVDIIDERARNEPHKEWLSAPRSSQPKDGWHPITYKQAANAINRIAHRIQKQLDSDPTLKSPESFPTIAYIGPNDARYPIMAFGAIKAGCQGLFISPRNTVEGQLNLFEKTNCNLIWFDSSFQGVVQPWLEGRKGMRAIMISSFDEWFSEDDAPPFPYNKTFEEAEWDPLLVMHTSGSTGLPKPIVVMQGMLAIADAFRELPEWNGTVTWIQGLAMRAERVFMPSESLSHKHSRPNSSQCADHIDPT